MPLIGERPLKASFGSRLTSAFAEHGQLCIGIDPSGEQLQSWNLPDSIQGLREFSDRMLDCSIGQVGIIKPQVAFFERFGAKGFSVLEDLCQRATQNQLIVIADAKRGDVGSTMAGYAKAWLVQNAPFVVDALTLSPYLGAESLAETISLAKENNRGVFILAATSNPEAAQLQRSKLVSSETEGASNQDSDTVANSIAKFAASHNISGHNLGSVGIVIGATVSAESMGIATDELITTPILAPGFGAQGATLSELSSLFGKLSGNVICNVGRSVAGRASDGIEDRIEAAKRELKMGLEG
jgi:orotidine-5'-phosphate decarboxylase